MSKNRHYYKNLPARTGIARESGEFRCTHCHALVSTAYEISRVHNRNHCPYCLWSRHVDLRRAGDRGAACQASMQPIGLTLKQTYKKYQREASGELMLIHQCIGCGKISINRIAADDANERIIDLFHQSLSLDETVLDTLILDGIRILQKNDFEIVKTRLYGKAD